MSESLKPEVKKDRKVVRSGLRAGATALALTVLATATDVVPAFASGPARQEQLSEAEKLERQAARKHAKAIQRELNGTGTSKNARYYSGAQFVVKPEYQEKYGVGVIYHPLKLRGGAVGYFHYTGQEADAKVITSFIDADHGTFEPGYGPVDMSTWKPDIVRTDLEMIDFDYTPNVPNDPHNTMRIVVAADEVQTFVGQWTGYVTVGPNQP